MFSSRYGTCCNVHSLVRVVFCHLLSHQSRLCATAVEISTKRYRPSRHASGEASQPSAKCVQCSCVYRCPGMKITHSTAAVRGFFYAYAHRAIMTAHVVYHVVAHRSDSLSPPPSTTLAGVLHALRCGKPKGRVRVYGERVLRWYVARAGRFHGDRRDSLLAKVSQRFCCT